MATVLILGGCGFIGRNLVTYLKKEGLAKKVRVADKSMPDLAGLSEAQKELYKSDFVDYTQANLSNPRMIEKAFKEDFGPWDYVINLASETKYSQSDEVYKENIIDIADKCTAEAAKHSSIKRWVEVSTAQVYDSGKKASSEDSKIKPWTKMASAKLAAEEKVKASGVPYTILRCAVVYGPGDIFGVTPRIICAATYTKTNDKMEFLWDKDLKLNTVHVDDVVRAIWHVCTKSDCAKKVFNLADSFDTDQGKINKFLEAIFGIKTGFLGNMKSKVATSVAMKTVTETANDKHLGPWGDLCKEKNISFTPLTPYLDEELLYNNSLAVDGTAITSTGFSYTRPEMTEQSLRDVIAYFVANNAFPDGLVR